MLTYQYRCVCDADCDRLRIIRQYGHDLACKAFNERQRARFDREYSEARAIRQEAE